MFENVPKSQPQATPPPASMPASTATPGVPPVNPPKLTRPLKNPPSALEMLTNEQTELFKRTSLTGPHKLALLLLFVLVIVGLIVGGVVLFRALDPFAGSQGGVSNQNNNGNTNSDIPLQQLDTDKDGLRDIDERRYNTDSNLADTDGDGLSDYVEVNQYKTNPTKVDTDGDTYGDKAELDNGYDPLGSGKLTK